MDYEHTGKFRFTGPFHFMLSYAKTAAVQTAGTVTDLGISAVQPAPPHSPQKFPNCQKATALAAATFRESTPWVMGILMV